MGGNVYYVSSSTSADCPQPCHPLSYYVTDTASFFTSDATFVFMEGEHLLHTGLAQVAINDIDNLTLRGERSHSNTNVIITCSRNTRGMVFNNGGIVTIYDITITGCGQLGISPLSLININIVNVHYLTIYNNTIHTSGGLYIQWNSTSTCNKLIIANSIFAHNVIHGDGGGLYINSHTSTGTHADIAIASSIFTHNNIYDRGCGLGIANYNNIASYTDTRISISASAITDNVIYGHGGCGLLIYSSTGTNNNITITNTTYSNNNLLDGYGMYIKASGTNNNITITQGTYTNNIVGTCAECMGSAVLLQSESNCTITIINSEFSNNTIVNDGGGVLTIVYSGIGGNRSITIFNSKFSDNNVNAGKYRIGGGFSLSANSNSFNYITIASSKFTGNKAGNTGGGCYLQFQSNSYNRIII